jgi:MFS transporter, DHA2 family, multidrug resistance protein
MNKEHDVTSGDGPRAGRREWTALAVLALPTLLVSIDVFVVLLALPRLSAALRASSTEQLWILDIYGFMVSGLMITMGTLGDRIGRRRLLLIGAAAFGVASMLAAFSTSPLMLIAARALLGIAGATLSPSILALISNMFRDPRQQASAVGVWAGWFTVGAIVGPIVGGLMLEHFWWGSVFLLGVPVMVLLLVVGPVLLPEHRDTGAGRLDLASVALSLAAILPIVYGLKELARSGWQPLPLAAIVAGVAFGVWFVRRQNALADPLLDVRLFASRAFSTTLGSMLLYTMLSGGTLVFVAQHLQLVEGLSPLRAGLALVPGMVAALVSFQVAPLIARWLRPAFLISAGLVVTVTGLLLITRADAASGLPALLMGFALTSFGTGPLIGLGTNLVVGSAPPRKAGSAAALSETGNELGYALGIAALGSIGTAVYRAQVADSIPAGVPAAAAATARDSLTSATVAAQHLSDPLSGALLAAAHEAFTAELHAVAAVSAAVLAGIAVLIVTTLRNVRPIGQGEPEGVQAGVTGADPEAA